MKSINTALVATLLLTACSEREPPSPTTRQTPPVAAESKQVKPLRSVTGTIILMPWKAGGREYYVLEVRESTFIFLDPSKAIQYEHFKNFVGQKVICKGQLVTGNPYILPADSAEQVSSPVVNLLGEEEPVLEGAFEVYAIDLIATNATYTEPKHAR